MTEKDPISKLAEKAKSKNDPESREYLLTHHLTKEFLDKLFLSFWIIRSMFILDNRNPLINPWIRKVFLQRKYRTGLLQDGILANELYFPNEEQTFLESFQAPAGRWFAYNFRAKTELNLKDRPPRDQWKGGRLITLLPEELKGRSANDYTPTFYVDFCSTDILNFDAPSLEQIINDGLIRETNYKEAYERVGLYEKYSRFLILAGLTDREIYQVTPKGNGLVFILPETGDKAPKPKYSPVLKPSHAFPSY